MHWARCPKMRGIPVMQKKQPTLDICRRCPLLSGMPTVRGPWPRAERSVAPLRPIRLEAGSKGHASAATGPRPPPVATDLNIRRAPTQHAKEPGGAVQPNIQHTPPDSCMRSALELRTSKRSYT